MERTDPSVFQLPVEKLRAGHWSDQYFNLTKELLEADKHFPEVTMQCFQRKHSLCGGVDEAVAILKRCAGETATAEREKYIRETMDLDPCTGPYGPMFWNLGWEDLEVKALHEGDEIEPWEPVLQIKGPYHLFAHLETAYLGVMARRSLVMKNVKDVCNAANGKPIIFMAARHDHWVVQTGDGMAAHAAGISGVSTDANASWWGGKGIGTIPHALIAAYGGNTVLAAQKFADRYAKKMNVTVLVDFDNTSINTALEVADELGDSLWGIRLDNSGTLVDDSYAYNIDTGDTFGVQSRFDYGSFKPTGVCPELVEETRKALDDGGYQHVKILVSGGFDVEKISAFEKSEVPVDAYGVGSSLLRGSNDYTADIVAPCAKVGRFKHDDSRLELVT